MYCLNEDPYMKMCLPQLSGDSCFGFKSEYFLGLFNSIIKIGKMLTKN